MALPALCDPTALEAWLGIEFDAKEDTARAKAFLAAASTLVRGEAGLNWVDEEGELEDGIPDAITTVVVIVAARVWNNPAGEITQGSGPFASSFEREAAQVLYLTNADKAMIHKALDTDPSPGLWTLATTRSDDDAGDLPSIFLDVEPTGDPIPWVNRDGF